MNLLSKVQTLIFAASLTFVSGVSAQEFEQAEQAQETTAPSQVEQPEGAIARPAPANSEARRTPRFSAEADPRSSLQTPLPPLSHPPLFLLDLGAYTFAPLLAEPVCGNRPTCVLGFGLGVAFDFEARFPDQWGVFGALRISFVDSDGVFEVGALNSLHLGVRRTFNEWGQVHPFVDASLGFVLFTDTLKPMTAGGMLSVGGGAEFEITDSFGVTTAARMSGTTLGAFRTKDGLERASDFGVNIGFEVSVGLKLLVSDLTL